jgi:hypothetical protein
MVSLVLTDLVSEEVLLYVCLSVPLSDVSTGKNKVIDLEVSDLGKGGRIGLRSKAKGLPTCIGPGISSLRIKRRWTQF